MGKGSPTGDLDLTATLTQNCGAKMNHFSYCNAEADKIIDAQRGTVDIAKRNEMLARLLKIFYEEAPAVVLYYQDQIFATRANIHDVWVNPNEFIGFFKAWKE